MRIFLDIGHPAHVHYFRNFIKIMQEKGHDFFISARDKEVSQYLLRSYGIPFFGRGSGSTSLTGKFLYLLKAERILYNEAKKFRPDIFLSFASPYLAHLSQIFNKPHITFTDTEKARLGILSFAPFTECILTPACFKHDFGNKHIRFNGFMELCYLHPDYFLPSRNNLNDLKLKETEQYALLRFVSWGASHDIGQSGISDKEKAALVDLLSDKFKVFISSENSLPASLEANRIKIRPDLIHDVLRYSALCISEGATIASECAMIGTPVVYINTLTAGTIEKQVEYGLLSRFSSFIKARPKIEELLRMKNPENDSEHRRSVMLSDQINVTRFMVWFVENYPESSGIMKSDPEYQFRFK